MAPRRRPVEPRPRVTVRDVARLSGVSPMTVSRVLNHSALVAPETAARVRAVLDSVDFRPNFSARNLRRGHNVTMVGLVVYDIANPFYATLSRAIEDVARDNGALLAVSSCGEDPTREREVVTTLLAHGLDGLLLYPTVGDHGYLREDPLEKRPIVSLGRPSGGIETDVVAVDNVDGARQAVEHLIAHGHRRIGLIAYGRRQELAEDPRVDHRVGRIEGYRRALQDAGLPFDPDLVRLGCDGAAEAADAVRDLIALPAPPSAFFTLNNRMTVGALRALGLGLRGMALVGFDDFEFAEVFDPPVTVVTQDPRQMGERAAQLFFSRLSGYDGPPERITLPMTLIQRGSGEVRVRR